LESWEPSQHLLLGTRKPRKTFVERDCPKHVEFYSKNKFENLVHLVGFVIRMHQTVSIHWIEK